MRIFEMEEGKQYRREDVALTKYEKRSGLLWNVNDKCWSILTMQEISQSDFIELPWKPALNEMYFFVDITQLGGYGKKRYIDTWIDEILMGRGNIYKTAEEVIAVIELIERKWRER